MTVSHTSDGSITHIKMSIKLSYIAYLSCRLLCITLQTYDKFTLNIKRMCAMLTVADCCVSVCYQPDNLYPGFSGAATRKMRSRACRPQRGGDLKHIPMSPTRCHYSNISFDR